jgi:transcriptional enhancer factor
MELQHHQSGVPHGSALNTPSIGTPLGCTSQRGVLQERSANWPHDNTASPLTDTQHVPLKVPRSESPTENAYSQQATTVGNYYTGSLHAQHIGLSGCGVEKSERQISKELKRLYTLLARCERYQKYREKQPVLTPREFIEREAAEAKLKEERKKLEAEMKIVREKPKPETSVWPEFLEHAFWRGGWTKQGSDNDDLETDQKNSPHQMAAHGPQEIHAGRRSPWAQRTYPRLHLQGHRHRAVP